MISAALTSAKTSIWSEFKSARCRPLTKLSALSAALIMCKIRMRSSSGILHLGGAHHLVSEISAELLRGSQIDPPSAQ